MKAQKKIFLLVLVFGCSLLSAQNNFKSVENFIKLKGDSLISNGNIPGLIIGVFFNGQQYFYDFGYAVPDERKAFDKNTVFEIGSITKTFTAYLLESVLKEKGIEDTLSIIPFLPDSIQANESLNKITFKNLLNHTSGLPRLPSNMPLLSRQPYDAYSVDHLYTYLKSVELIQEGKSNYSNTGFGLAGVLTENISGLRYKEALEKYIFLPFDMTDVGNDSSYTKSQGYMGNDKTPYWNMKSIYGAGGIKSNGEQLLKYLRLISSPSEKLDKAVVEKLLTPTISISKNLKIGLGWHMFESPGRATIYWHNGGTYGFSTFAAFVKEKERAVIIAVNKFNQNQISDSFGLEILNKLANLK